MSSKGKSIDYVNNLDKVRKDIRTYLEFNRPKLGYTESLRTLGKVQTIAVQNGLGECTIEDYLKIFNDEIDYYKKRHKS